MNRNNRPTKKRPAKRRPAKRRPAKRRPAKRRPAVNRSTRDPLERVRKLCLALPEAHEVEAWGEPTFRVRNKVFAMYASASTHHGGGRPGIWCKNVSIEQDLLIRSFPKLYFSPPYVGPGGWVGVWLDGRPDWKALEELLRDAWRLTAPKKMHGLLDD